VYRTADWLNVVFLFNSAVGLGDESSPSAMTDVFRIHQALFGWRCTNLVDPASSHMLVSKIKPCMSQYKLLYGETANGSLKQL
jgi:hypothetical protein